MTEHENDAPYRVLARKYRPATFSELIGQDAMVRTLRNAIAAGRLAHAFILTGVRGVGKTTTARIIARALNCVGPDGGGGPTADPCGACDFCRAITEDRDVDVIEMDAASRTGVEDIRDLIEGVRYRPVAARYKIYIIDEVHMLSKSAFNALLKTLEEPPEHVKFIFATTEVRRVPVTVLSRCQRFDLRRVEPETLVTHLAEIADKEGAAIEAPALALIARAADGSVRDGLSLLDTAIAQGPGDGGAGAISEAHVRDMLGLADRARVIDLFDHVMKGEVAPGLDVLGELHAAGADPAVVVQDLLEFCHELTRLKIVPDGAAGREGGAGDRARAAAMAAALSVPTLARTWQMLLKGLGEVRAAPSPITATEMVLVRLAYAAELPAPADLLRRLDEGSAPRQGEDRGETAGPVPPAPSGPGRAEIVSAPPAAGPLPAAPLSEEIGAGSPPQASLAAGYSLAEAAPSGSPAGAAATVETGAAETTTLGTTALGTAAATPQLAEGGAEAEAAAEAAAAAVEGPGSFEEVVALFARHREAVLHAHLTADVHLVRFEPGRIEFRPGAQAPANLANRLGELLRRWTGRRWVVSVATEGGAPTLRQQGEAEEAKVRQEAAADPAVRAVLDAFPGATIAAVRDRDGPDSRSTEGDETP